MTDRTVKVSLIAQVSGYIQGMQKAADATKKTGSEAEKLAQKKEAFNQLGNAALAMGAVAAAGVAIAIKKFADWDAQMAQVRTLSHATADDMDKLRDASLNMGQAIGFSATEVADAETELVKAGISVKDMLGGALAGALDLAAAGQINVADATSIAASAMTQFQLQGKDVPHIADLLAAGADKALGSVSDLGQGLKYVGPIAQSMGISIEQTVGTLSLFAQNGILADQAGTGLRGVLLSLTSPSKVASDEMKKYGINLYDAQGKFIGINGAAQQLKDGLGGLDQATRDQALGQIFGNQQITEAAILMDGGAKAVDKWTKAVDDQGFAAEQARGKMDSLNGDLSKLGASFDTALIKTGSTANDVLRGTVQGITGLTKAFADLPGPAQGAVIATAALVAGIGLVGGGLFKVIPMIANFKTALSELGTSMRTVGIAGGVVGVAITALVTILAAVGAAQADAKQTAEDLSDTLDQETGAITKNTRAYAADKLQKDGTIKSAKALGLSAKDVVDAYLQQPAALEKARKALADMKDANSDLRKSISSGDELGKMSDGALDLEKALGDGAGATRDAKERLQELRDASDDASHATDENKDSVQAAGQAYLDSAGEVNGLKDQVSQLTDEINKANGVGQDAVSANASYQDALAKVQDTIEKAKAGTDGYSTSLDANTAAGADNIAMFSDQAAKSQAAAKAQLDLDGNTGNYIATLQAGRQKLIDNIVALGGTAAQAGAVADQVYRIPEERAVQILADAAQALRNVELFKAALNTIDRQVVIHQRFIQDNLPAPIARAAGGILPGAPSSTDNMLIHAATGEFVVNALATARPENRAMLEFINAGGRIPGRAAGGMVTPTYVPASSYASMHSNGGHGGVKYDVNITAPAIETQDSRVYATIIGREFGRRIAG